MTTETMSKASARNYTTSELLAVMASRLLRDGQVVFAGWGSYGIYVEIDHGNGFHSI